MSLACLQALPQGGATASEKKGVSLVSGGELWAQRRKWNVNAELLPLPSVGCVLLTGPLSKTTQ